MTLLLNTKTKTGADLDFSLVDDMGIGQSKWVERYIFLVVSAQRKIFSFTWLFC